MIFPNLEPEIREDFYDFPDENKRKDFERLFTCIEIIRCYIRENTDNDSILLTQLAKNYSEESPEYANQSWILSRNTLEFLQQWKMVKNPFFDDATYVASQ